MQIFWKTNIKIYRPIKFSFKSTLDNEKKKVTFSWKFSKNKKRFYSFSTLTLLRFKHLKDKCLYVMRLKQKYKDRKLLTTAVKMAKKY